MVFLSEVEAQKCDCKQLKIRLTIEVMAKNDS